MKKTKEQISFNMRQVKNKDSQIELLLRRELWQRGLHYRKNVADVFGKPDIVFKSKKVAVFCDSEFWHGYDWERRKLEIKTHQEFWIPKIERTIARDKEVSSKLESEGWIVLRFWGKEIKNDVEQCADIVEKAVHDYGKHKSN